MYKLDLEKAEKSEIKLPTLIGSQKKQGNYRKTSTFASLTTLKPLTLCITKTVKILKEVGVLFRLTQLLRNLYASKEETVRTRHGTTDWFKIGKGVQDKYVYCHSPNLTSMQSTSCKMLGWMNHKLESRLPGKILITSDMQITPR